MRTLNRFTALFFTLLVVLIFVSACAQAPAVTTPPPAPSTATPTVKPTRTRIPTKTATITPTGTRTGTITPTHNLAPAATITPQPSADCPPFDPNTVLDTSGFDQLEAITMEAGIGQRIGPETAAIAFDAAHQNIIDFLNQGGDLSTLQSLLAMQNVSEEAYYYAELMVAEVTGDNEPEIFVLMALPITWHEAKGYPEPDTGSWFTGSGQHSNLAVISCQEEQYERLAWFKDEHGALVIPTILDLNADGIAEIIQPSHSSAALTPYLDLEILAWDGKGFSQQISEADLYVTHWYFQDAGISRQHVSVSNGEFEFADIDGNDTIEVLILGGSFSACAIGTRTGDIILQWTGHNYSSYLLRTSPEFRIHAVRDGDHMTARGFFDEALAFYDRVLNDAALKTWSPDYVDFNDFKCSSTPLDPTEPVPQNPRLDEQEYDRLAAYTLYRLMLLHTARGDLDMARSYYDRLFNEYASSVNASYVELASTFWKAYSKSGELNSACEAARSYSEEHKESVLIPLGSYYGADYARKYAANDICPFGVKTGA